MTNIERQSFKITFIKAGSVLVGCAAICITIGVTGGEWIAWRKNIETRVTQVEKDTKDLSTWKHDQIILSARRK